MRGLVVLLMAIGCSRDECKEGAFATEGFCMPICPAVECGDGVCMRYVWPDGLWNDELLCETHKTCPADCDDTYLNAATMALFALFDIDDAAFIPNPAEGVSVSGACDDGGQVTVSGTRGCLTLGGLKTCTHDLTYAFSNCVYESAYPEGRMVFNTGSLRGYWTYVETDSTPAIAYQVTGQVTLSGTVEAGYTLAQTTEVLPQASCEVNFTRITGDGVAETVGTICGHTIVTPRYP
jgi:hypothetical protein